MKDVWHLLITIFITGRQKCHSLKWLQTEKGRFSSPEVHEYLIVSYSWWFVKPLLVRAPFFVQQFKTIAGLSLIVWSSRESVFVMYAHLHLHIHTQRLIGFIFSSFVATRSFVFTCLCLFYSPLHVQFFSFCFIHANLHSPSKLVGQMQH